MSRPRNPGYSGWLPIAIHFAWNFLLGPGLGLTVSRQDLGSSWQAFAVNGPAAFTGGTFGLEGGLVVAATTLTMIALLFVLRPNLYAPVNKEDAITCL